MVHLFFNWGFSGFYGFRIHSDEVELIYVWPKESVSIPRSILLRGDYEITKKNTGLLRLSTKAGVFRSLFVDWKDHELGREAARRINGAVIQP